ncbi:MAG TPA: helix-turn-helix transcriptional regulator [Acidobacteriota bacterium]|nr:helix-turn-helix transcriptional regulator [Acidobacteriota bacterium]
MHGPFDQKIAARIGANIRKRRKLELKLTQEQLAEAGGYEPGYISEVERAVKRPSLGFLFNIARALNTSAAELLEGVDETPLEEVMEQETDPDLRFEIQNRFQELHGLLEEYLHNGSQPALLSGARQR